MSSGIPMLLCEPRELLDRLCHCVPCLRGYAQDRLFQLFLGEGGECLDPDCQQYADAATAAQEAAAASAAAAAVRGTGIHGSGSAAAESLAARLSRPHARPRDSVSEAVTSLIQGLPHEGQVHVAAGIGLFRRVMGTFLQRLAAQQHASGGASGGAGSSGGVRDITELTEAQLQEFKDMLAAARAEEADRIARGEL